MAVTTTALDFKIPDGNELVNGGDNLIGHNAQTAQDLITADRARLSTIETTNVTHSNRLTAAESKNTSQDATLSSISGRVSYVEAVIAAGGGSGEPGTGSTLTPDPDNPGLYFAV